ncbi:hypothetical protein ALT761_01804 [Alteromonas sp. 76-1]|jgi:hypothetical protein|nr:hypothetical protein ALT761_01804 [Alteromonas sp. 76-1]
MYGRAKIDRRYTLFEGELGGEYAVLLCGAAMRYYYAVLAFITKSPSVHIKGLFLNRIALR